MQRVAAPVGQSDGSGGLSAIVAVAWAFRAAVAEIARARIWGQGGNCDYWGRGRDTDWRLYWRHKSEKINPEIAPIVYQ